VPVVVLDTARSTPRRCWQGRSAAGPGTPHGTSPPSARLACADRKERRTSSGLRHNARSTNDQTNRPLSMKASKPQRIVALHRKAPDHGPARVNLHEAVVFGNQWVVVGSSFGSLIHAPLRRGGGWGGLGGEGRGG